MEFNGEGGELNGGPKDIFRPPDLHATVNLDEGGLAEATGFFSNLKQDLEGDVEKHRRNFERFNAPGIMGSIRRLNPISARDPETDKELIRKSEWSARCSESIDALRAGSAYKPERLLLDYLADTYTDLIFTGRQYETMGGYNAAPITSGIKALKVLELLDPNRAGKVKSLLMDNTPPKMKELWNK